MLPCLLVGKHLITGFAGETPINPLLMCLNPEELVCSSQEYFPSAEHNEKH